MSHALGIRREHLKSNHGNGGNEMIDGIGVLTENLSSKNGAGGRKMYKTLGMRLVVVAAGAAMLLGLAAACGECAGYPLGVVDEGVAGRCLGALLKRAEVLVDQELLALLVLAVPIDERVRHDLEEPRLAVRPLLILLEVAEGFEHGLLNEILGVILILGQAKRRRVEGVKVWHRLLVECLVEQLVVIFTTKHFSPPC